MVNFIAALDQLAQHRVEFLLYCAAYAPVGQLVYIALGVILRIVVRTVIPRHCPIFVWAGRQGAVAQQVCIDIEFAKFIYDYGNSLARGVF